MTKKLGECIRPVFEEISPQEKVRVLCMIINSIKEENLLIRDLYADLNEARSIKLP